MDTGYEDNACFISHTLQSDNENIIAFESDGAARAAGDARTKILSAS